MKLVLIRHAEPTSDNQTLTNKGLKEATLLGEYYKGAKFDAIYASPLTRADLTAKALVGSGNYITLDWLQEFTHPVLIDGERHHNWDFLPSQIKNHPEIYKENFLDTDIGKSGNLREEYNNVISNLDNLLEKHGYKREGIYYEAINSNTDTVVLVCHLGLISVIMSHLLHIPYNLLTQHFFVAPTGVTTIYTEEREKGIAQFRLNEFSNLTHLTNKKEPPSKHGSFCEIFDSSDRH